MRVLVTAIGSMSAECVINHLKADGCYVVGCDIYPKQWHYESTLCDSFYQSPLAIDERRYINFLLGICGDENLDFIIPLTDLEIDIIEKNRMSFEEQEITLCMQTSSVLHIVRDKYKLHYFFKDDSFVPSVRTCRLNDIPDKFPFPCIAKPYNGRSSEGLLRDATIEQLLTIQDKERYIVQEQIEGDVFTVDYCRSSFFNCDAIVPRKELLRTKNGAGVTVAITSDSKLLSLVSHIGQKLNINGCINMEFIYSGGKYFLIDINPRFSAGVAFSALAGYNMVRNHIRCFEKKQIDPQIELSEQIMIKKYTEVYL